MTYVVQGEGGLEYYPCRYGRSRVLFRGPRRRLDGDYIAFLGGTDTYGRFIETPFPALTERALHRTCVNFGNVNAGLDLYLTDPSVIDLASGARATVVQVMGAQNLSNRYYTVHPRRNDRFLRASKILQSIYSDVDFTEFHFTRHMLTHLRDLSADRFELLAEELRSAWIARMKLMLGGLRGPAVLLWFAGHPPPPEGDTTLGRDPLFVDRSMIDVLRPRVAAVVEVTASEAAQRTGTSGMVFGEFDACAAAESLGPAAHREAADALTTVLSSMLPDSLGKADPAA